MHHEHPMAVRVPVALMAGPSDSVEADGRAPANVSRQVEYLVGPEFKAPGFAVAANSGEGQDAPKMI